MLKAITSLKNKKSNESKLLK